MDYGELSSATGKIQLSSLKYLLLERPLIKTTKQRIFIECTHTFINGGNGGIQRVVRNLVNKSSIINSADAEIIPIVWTGICFFQPKDKISVKPWRLIRIKKRIRRLLFPRSKKIPSLLKTSIVWFARLVMTKKRREAVFDFILDMPYVLVGLGYILLGRLVRFRHGDIITLVDSTWRSRAMLKTLFKVQHNQDVKLGVMIHDLFPLLLPDMCEEITSQGYVDWFNRIVPRCDFFVTNTESTRLSLQQFLDENIQFRPHPYASGSFRLGAELECDAENKSKKISKRLQSLSDTSGMTMLSIGTIEPRKNYAYILDTFDILRQRVSDVSLIIIGRPGWSNSAILKRIRSHRDFGTRLLFFDKATDQDLAETMEIADCLVCASIAEGFGLPVVEGLMHGLEVFASDIPPFREIGTGYCHLFNLNSPVSLADQLEKRFGNTISGKKTTTKKKFSWPDWKESTREFIQLTLKLANSN